MTPSTGHWPAKPEPQTEGRRPVALFSSKTRQVMTNIDKALAAGKMTAAEAEDRRRLARAQQVIASRRAREYGSATQ